MTGALGVEKSGRNEPEGFRKVAVRGAYAVAPQALLSEQVQTSIKYPRRFRHCPDGATPVHSRPSFLTAAAEKASRSGHLFGADPFRLELPSGLGGPGAPESTAPCPNSPDFKELSRAHT